MSIRKPYILYLFGSFAILLVIGAIYKDKFLGALVLAASEQEEKQARTFIGQTAPNDTLVRIDGNAKAMRLSDILNTDSILIIYRDNCSACRSVLNHYLAIKRGRADYGETVYFLVEGADEAIPSGISCNQILYLAEQGTSQMLRGRSTPRIYQFDGNGKLTDAVVGYTDTLFAQWLKSMYGE